MTSSKMALIQEFIRSRNADLNKDIPSDFDLIDSRLINSLAFVEFIFLLEEITGDSIDPEELDVDDFRTLDAIESRFFSSEENK